MLKLDDNGSLISLPTIEPEHSHVWFQALQRPNHKLALMESIHSGGATLRYTFYADTESITNGRHASVDPFVRLNGDHDNHLPRDFDAFEYTLTEAGALYFCSAWAPAIIESIAGTITNPFGEGGYLFFIDEQPAANWGHPCVYIFVKNGVVELVESNMPPEALPLLPQEERI